MTTTNKDSMMTVKPTSSDATPNLDVLPVGTVDDYELYAAILKSSVNDVSRLAASMLGTTDFVGDADISRWLGDGWDSSTHPVI